MGLVVVVVVEGKFFFRFCISGLGEFMMYDMGLVDYIMEL